MPDPVFKILISVNPLTSYEIKIKGNEKHN
jgi:hypothetical protein